MDAHLRQFGLVGVSILLPTFVVQAQGRWQEIHAFESRSSARMAYDSTAGRVLCFGGSFSGQYLYPDNLWAWTGTAWKARQLAVKPRGRSGPSFADYPAKKGVLLYGGITLDPLAPFAGRRFINDTWLWDGRKWILQKPISSPNPARNAQATAYDPQRKAMVIFGGNISLMVPNPIDETWEYDGTTWAQRFPKNKPAKRLYASMARHPVTGKLLLFGGAATSTQYFGDTWEWDGTDWTKLADPVQGLGLRSGAKLLTIPWKNTVYLLGGYDYSTSSYRADIWEWTGQTWKLVPNSQPPFPEMRNGAVADPTLKKIFVTGGTPTLKNDGRQNTTWCWDGKTWTQVGQGSQQEAHAWQASYAFDPRRDQILALVAPEDGQPSKHPLETWALPTGGQWTRLKPKTSPPGYVTTSGLLPRMVFHAALGVMVMCLETSTGMETWLWDGSDWRKESSQQMPRTTQLCYDSLRKLVVSMEYDSLNTRNMWAWDSTGWKKTHVGVTAPRLIDGVDGWAYDPKRDRIVAFNSPGSSLQVVTSEWDGKSWQISDQGGGKINGAKLFYHAGLGGVVACGGIDFSSRPVHENEDSWLWDGKSWTKLVGPKLPMQRNQPMMQAFYDPGRQRGIAVYPGPVPSQLWEFRLDTLMASQPYPRPGEAFTMDVNMPTQAGNPFVLAFAGGTRPGIPLRKVPMVGTEILPLTPDPLFLLSLQLGLITGLDKQGKASIPLRFPNSANLLWLNLHMAGVTFDKSGIAVISDQVPITIVK